MKTSNSFIRTVIQSWRLVAPPLVMWCLLALFWVVIESIVLWIAWLLGDWHDALKLHAIGASAVMLFAWLYGVLRVVLHHPLFNFQYRDFLAATPWQRTKPLPLGPVRLTFQDLGVLGVLIAMMAVQSEIPLIAPVVAFLVGYLMILGSTLSRTGESWAAFGVCFGLGLALRMAWWNHWAAVAALAATTAVAQYGLWRSWLRFPWNQELAAQKRSAVEYDWRKAVGKQQRRHADPVDAGNLWPHSGLGFSQPNRALNPWQSWLSAALVGWWIYAAAGPVPVGPRDVHQAGSLVFDPSDVHGIALFLFTVVSGIIALARLAIYAMAHHPPLSFFGRIATRYYIIPEYDVVFLTPLLVAVMGLPTYFGLYLVGVPAVTALAITVVLVIGVACTGGPRLRQWQLTAPCRISFPVGGSGKDVQAI